MENRPVARYTWGGRPRPQPVPDRPGSAAGQPTGASAAGRGSYCGLVSVEVVPESRVVDFTTLPCFFFTFVVLFAVCVVEVVPAGSDVVFRVVVVSSVVTLRPLSRLVVTVVD